MAKDPHIEKVLENQRHWELDNISNIVNESKRNKFLVRVMTMALVIGMAALLYNLMTAKKEVYREVIDPYTGHVVMDKVYSEGEVLPIEKQELYLKSDVYKFVNCFEGYSMAQVNTNLKCVNAFSTFPVFKQYKSYIEQDDGIKQLIGSLGVMNVKFGHITQLSNDKNTIVAEILLIPEGVNVPKDQKPIAKLITIVFEYKAIPSKLEKFLINPHGLVVKTYQSDQK